MTGGENPIGSKAKTKGIRRIASKFGRRNFSVVYEWFKDFLQSQRVQIDKNIFKVRLFERRGISYRLKSQNKKGFEE